MRRIRRYWPLIIADFRREYQISADDLFDLNGREFLWLLGGLSAESRWAHATSNEPVELDSDAVQALVSRL